MLLSVPDEKIRKDLRDLALGSVLPAYQAFYEKLHNVPFSKKKMKVPNISYNLNLIMLPPFPRALTLPKSPRLFLSFALAFYLKEYVRHTPEDVENKLGRFFCDV
jgi:hypothetical protein